MNVREIETIVSETLNGIEGVESLGRPTVEEIALGIFSEHFAESAQVTT